MTPQRPDWGNGQKNQVIAQTDRLLRILAGAGIIITLRPDINHCEPDWKWTPPPFQDFDLWVVLAGHGELQIKRTRYPLEAGSCVIFQPGDRGVEATHDPADPLIVFYCHFLPRPFKRNTRRPCANFIHAKLEEMAPLHHSAEMVSEVFDQGNAGRQLAAATVAQLIAYVLYRMRQPAERGPGRSRLSKLTLEIRSQPGLFWTTSEMARRCALSVPHLNRKFRELFGLPPIQYVIRQRVFRAVILLRESDLSIEQIAASLGYSDVFFFHRQFRQIAGMTPRSARLGKLPGRASRKATTG